MTEIYSQEPEVKLDIQFRNFLRKCKEFALNITDQNFWRIEKYVLYLDDLLRQLQSSPYKTCSDELLLTYRNDVRFLQDLVQTSKPKSTEEKILAVQKLVVPEERIDTRKYRDDDEPKVSLRQVKMRVSSKYDRDLRQQLLRVTDEDRTDSQQGDEESEANVSLETNERLADQFLNMTKLLKENATTAGIIVRRDNKTIEQMVELADKTSVNLGKHSQRVDTFSRFRADCWLWLILLFIGLTFVGMVLFIRLFPVRRY